MTTDPATYATNGKPSTNQNSVAFARMRHMIEALQLIAQQMALTGAVGPLLVYDRRTTSDPHNSNAAPRYEFATLTSPNHRALARDIVAKVMSSAVTQEITAVAMLRTCLHDPRPLSIRATVMAASIASRQVFASEAIISETEPANWRPSQPGRNDHSVQLMQLLNQVLSYAGDTRRDAIPINHLIGLAGGQYGADSHTETA